MQRDVGLAGPKSNDTRCMDGCQSTMDDCLNMYSPIPTSGNRDMFVLHCYHAGLEYIEGSHKAQI